MDSSAQESQCFGNPGDSRIYMATITGDKYGKDIRLNDSLKLGGGGGVPVTFGLCAFAGGGKVNSVTLVSMCSGDDSGGVPVTFGLCAFVGGGKVNSVTLVSMCSGDDSGGVPVTFGLCAFVGGGKDKDRCPDALPKFLCRKDSGLVVMGNALLPALLPAGLEMFEGSKSLVSLVKLAGFAGAPELKKETTIEGLAFMVLKKAYLKKIAALVKESTGIQHFNDEVTMAARDAYLTHKIAAATINLIEGRGLLRGLLSYSVLDGF